MSNGPPWLDLRISIPSLLTTIGAVILFLVSVGKLETRVDNLQSLILSQAGDVGILRNEMARKDVIDARLSSIEMRLARIERKLEQ